MCGVGVFEGVISGSDEKVGVLGVKSPLDRCVTGTLGIGT